MQEITRVLVCGGRRYADKDILCDCLDERLAAWRFLVLIHGDAEGADRLADAWALERGVQPAVCRANWSKWPRAAGFIRNDRMLILQPQVCIAFPGGRGTAHMIRQCESAGIAVRRVPARCDYVFNRPDMMYSRCGQQTLL